MFKIAKAKRQGRLKPTSTPNKTIRTEDIPTDYNSKKYKTYVDIGASLFGIACGITALIVMFANEHIWVVAVVIICATILGGILSKRVSEEK